MEFLTATLDGQIYPEHIINRVKYMMEQKDNIIIHHIINNLPNLIQYKLNIQLENIHEFMSHMMKLCDELHIYPDILLHACIIFNKYHSMLNYVAQIRKQSEILYTFLIIINISIKFCQDDPFRNKTISRYGKINCNRMLINELNFLDVLNWNLFITDDDVTNIAQILHIELETCSLITTNILSR